VGGGWRRGRGIAIIFYNNCINVGYGPWGIDILANTVTVSSRNKTCNGGEGAGGRGG